MPSIRHLVRPLAHAVTLGVILPTLTVLSPAALAAVPDYDEPRLVARTNFTGAFMLPDGVFATNSTPSLADDGRVALYLSFMPGDVRGVFVEGAGVAFTGEVGALLSDVSLNASGFVVFPQSFSSQDGVYFYDDADSSSGFLTGEPFGATTFSSPQTNEAGDVGLRGGFSAGRVFTIWDGSSAVNVAVEAGLDAGSPYSFLFTPSFDGEDVPGRGIAGKVRLGMNGQTGGDQPDEIRIFRVGGSTLIAEDQDAEPSSQFDSFDNGVSFRTGTGGDRVAFIATLTTGVRGVFVGDGATTTTIALDKDPRVTEIEFFHPVVNEDGLVAFRGVDENGLQALFIGDGTTLVRLIGEHDLIATDLGTARIDQNDGSPVFGGAPAINAAGDIAIRATLTPPDNDQVEWGTGLFVFPAGALFRDGFESGDLTGWGAVVP
ncbi:MAG: hypothetical protein AAGC60_09805 [Acidobacteriota bacterium]